MKLAAFTKTYAGRTVLDFPGMELQPERICAVIGANGSGKSTLARVLAGAIPPDKRCRITGAAVGYLPQKSYAFRRSLRKNLLLNGGSEARAEALMDELQLRPLENERADRLSGGETARMALARLLMRPYELLILDEPTAAMDMESTLLAEKLISDYVRESGCALLLVTHSLQQARRLAHEAVYLHKGRLVEHGSAGEVLWQPRCPETMAFLDFYGK